MVNARIDGNREKTLIGVSSVDLVTPELAAVNPTTNRLLTETTITDGTNTAIVNDSGQLHVVLRGAVDSNNSSATPILADAVFTGTATNILDYGFIFITVFSDVASATDGLSVQQSSDGTNWDNTDDFTIPAGTGKTYSFQPAAQFLRIVYTNGGSDQGAFRLQTVFKKTSSLPSSHKISTNLSPEDDGSLQIAIIKGQNPGGDYVDFSATTGGNFKVSLEELESAISSNSNSQLNVTPFHSDGTEGSMALGSDDTGTTKRIIRTDAGGALTPEAGNTTHGDGVSNQRYGIRANANKIYAPVFPHVYNGSTWDRLRGNTGGMSIAPSTGTNGGPVTVGTTEVEMTFTGTTGSIMIQSDSDNTGNVWIGLTGITNSGGNALAKLDPGSSISMDLNDASSAIFAISDTASQNVLKMALT